MYNLKNESDIISLIGIISYLYLFSSLVNNKYDIIFIYFTVLFIGYFIIGKRIYKYNVFIIIIDIVKNKIILREGNFESKFQKGKSNAESSDKFNKEGGSIETGEMSKDDGDELTDKMNKKDENNQKKKESKQNKYERP